MMRELEREGQVKLTHFNELQGRLKKKKMYNFTRKMLCSQYFHNKY